MVTDESGFMPWEGVITWLRVKRTVAHTILCSVAFSHTVTRIGPERLERQKYFSMCQKLLFNL